MLNTEKKTYKPVKIALVHPEYRPDGGAERLLSDIIKVLLRKNLEIVLVTRKWSEDTTDFKVVKCSGFYIGRIWKLWGFYRSAQKKLTDLDVDIVQSQVHLPNCNIYYAGGGLHREWLSQKSRISNSLKRKTTQLSPFHNLKKYLEKNTYCSGKLQAVICNSEMVREEISNHFDVPAEKLHTIYPGVDFKTFNTENRPRIRAEVRRSLGIADDRTVYLFVGSGFERKGVDALLKAFGRLPKDCELIVIGKDKNPGKYKKKAREQNALGRVHFLGLQEDVKSFYAAADVFVLPSLYDAFGLVIIEAMACGLPVIASNRCGAAYDLIENDQNGFSCDPLDIESLFGYMDKLQDPEVRRRIASNGTETAKSINLEQMSRNFDELYKKLLEHKNLDASAGNRP